MKGGAATVKAHPWFKTIDWDKLYHRKMQGPIVPHLRGADDTRNFDEYDAEPVHRDPYTKVYSHSWGLTVQRYDELTLKQEMYAKYDSMFTDF